MDTSKGCKTTKNKYLILFLVFLFLESCSKMGAFHIDSTSRKSSLRTIKPFENFKLSDQDEENHKSVFGSTGETRADYGYDELNSNLRGHFLFDKNRSTLVFSRAIVTGDIWADHTIFPPDNKDLNFQLGQISSISITIKAQINKSNPNIPTGCGISLGFGETAGHYSAINSPTSLRLFDRDWKLSFNKDKTPRDFIRFVYEPYSQDEKFTVDAPINSYNALNRWDNFTASRYTEASGEFNVMTSNKISNEGDYITYKQILEFDHENALVKISIIPLDSNLDFSLWQKQSLVWNINNKVDQTNEFEDPRGGLDLRNIFGEESATWQSISKAKLHLGFVANLAPRLCEYSQLIVETKK
ncbi:MAG: hypothetical protein H6625_07105 [Bdellovibrionaceae bacterium]|nr:hypothetical protein [Pseudobdellovibrionaceae bacterium]